MSFWPNYVITEVHYDGTHTGISSVKRCPSVNEMHKMTVETRDRIVHDILSHVSHSTARRVNGTWRYAVVRVVHKRDGRLIIQTEGNDTETDNLGGLPEF